VILMVILIGKPSPQPNERGEGEKEGAYNT